jgi:DNA-binding MarR family transcriptional regulator
VDASRRAPKPASGPTPAELTVWRDFLRAHAAVTRALEDELMAARNVPLTWYDVLVQLVEAPGHKLRMAELADRVLLSRSGLTRLVDRLVKAGLVEREPVPDDARGTFTVLTDAGYAQLRDAAPLHLRGVGEHMLNHVRPDELGVLGAVFARIAEAHSVPGPPPERDEAAC